MGRGGYYFSMERRVPRLEQRVRELEERVQQGEALLRKRLAVAWHEGHQRGLRDAELEHVADNPYLEEQEYGGRDAD